MRKKIKWKGFLKISYKNNLLTLNLFFLFYFTFFFLLHSILIIFPIFFQNPNNGLNNSFNILSILSQVALNLHQTKGKLKRGRIKTTSLQMKTRLRTEKWLIEIWRFVPIKSTADSCLVTEAPKAFSFCKWRRRVWFSAKQHWSKCPSLLHSDSRYLLFNSKSLTYVFFLSLDLTAASRFLNCLKIKIHITSLYLEHTGGIQVAFPVDFLSHMVKGLSI